MLVQKAKEVDDRRKGGGFAALVARERIVAASGEARRRQLAQSKLATNAADFLALTLPILQHQLVAGSGVAPRAVGIELNLVAIFAAPARQVPHLDRQAGMRNRERFALETGHCSTGSAIQAFPRHSIAP